MRHPESDRVGIAWRVAAVLLTVAGALRSLSLYRLLLDNDRPPLWDMAKNSWQALEIARAIADLRPFEVLRAINAHELWPPGHTLILAPFVRLGETSTTSLALPGLLCFALTPLALLAVARQIEPGPGGWAAACLAASAWLASPSASLHAILILREVPGAFLTVVATALALRAGERADLRSWRQAAAAGLLLTTVKYNYGAAWILAMTAARVARLESSEIRALLAHLRPWLLPWAARTPLQRLTAVLSWIVAALWATGVAVGSAVWIALVVITIAAAADRRHRSVGAWLRELPPAPRAAIEWIVVPLWLWCLIPVPMHTRSILEFLRNRSSHLGWIDGALFYPRAFLDSYLPRPDLGWIALLLMLVGLASGLRRPRTAQGVLSIAVLTMGALAWVHPYKIDRFFLTTLPLALLVAGLTAARPLSAALSPRLRPAAAALLAVVGSTAIVVATVPDRQRLEHAYRVQSGDGRLVRPLDAITPHLPAGIRTGVLGSFNQLSPSLISWWAAQTAHGTPIRLEDRPPALPRDSSAGAVNDSLTDWISTRKLERIVGLALADDSPWRLSTDYVEFNAWQLRMIAGLATLDGWKLGAREVFPELGLDLEIWIRGSG